MPEDQIMEILRRLEVMAKEINSCSREVSKLGGIVDHITNETIKDLKAKVTALEVKHSKDIGELYKLMREHEKENHSSKVLSQFLINFGTMAATIASVYFMTKG